jgi:probable HAF family extracellular repeat protein
VGEMEGKWKRERGEKVQVTGYSNILPCSGSDCGPVHAFLYSNGTMNDRGQITGSGTHNGATRAFLLTPICSQNRQHNMDNDECDNEGQH